MPKFFAQDIKKGKYIITGEDAAHISFSLRMKRGDTLTFCDGHETDYPCVIDDMRTGEVLVDAGEPLPCQTEHRTKLTLYQGMPKSDKFENIIQKAVELGAYKIVPVVTARSVSRPDEKSSARKKVRWEKHSLEAAKQSMRGIVPQIGDAISFDAMLKLISAHEKAVIFYEGGGVSLKEILIAPISDIAVVIGPEGGFDEREVATAEAIGAVRATLGPRILRTETASLAAISIILNSL